MSANNGAVIKAASQTALHRLEPASLGRTTFTTSRLLDFFNRKELIAQTGHQPEVWPLVLLKELMDNALDACEDKAIAPEIAVRVDKRRRSE
jgi:DNA topoisomerase VI subunit B